MARTTANERPDFYDELGRRIAAFRKAASLSQEQLGERAVVGVSYVAHIEIGSRRPTLDVLMKLADALDVPLWRLITDDRMAPDEVTWDASARDLAEKVRGLDTNDLHALSYLAERLKKQSGQRSATVTLSRAADAKTPRRRTSAKRSAVKSRSRSGA